MANVMEEEFSATVVGKTTAQRGLFRKRTAYILGVRFEKLNPEHQQFPVQFAFWSDVSVGSKITVTLYSVDGKTYHRTPQAAKEHACRW